MKVETKEQESYSKSQKWRECKSKYGSIIHKDELLPPVKGIFIRVSAACFKKDLQFVLPFYFSSQAFSKKLCVCMCLFHIFFSWTIPEEHKIKHSKPETRWWQKWTHDHSTYVYTTEQMT